MITAMSRRRKILVGALGLVTLAWTVDYVGGGGKTAAVKAANTVTSGATPDEPSPPNGLDTSEILAALRKNSNPTPPLRTDRLGRDLFAPTAVLRSACNAMNTDPAVEAAATAAPEPAEADEFGRRHELQGVLTGGRVPLAIIDGQLFKTGAKLEGYTVVRIERERVVCERGGRQTELTLRRGDANGK